MNITIMFNFSFHFSILIPVPTGTTPPEVGVVPCPPPGSSPSVWSGPTPPRHTLGSVSSWCTLDNSLTTISLRFVNSFCTFSIGSTRIVLLSSLYHPHVGFYLFLIVFQFPNLLHSLSPRTPSPCTLVFPFYSIPCSLAQLETDYPQTIAGPSQTTFAPFLSVRCAQTCTNTLPCFPIEIPTNDTRISASCMPFVRSAAICGMFSTP